MIKPLDAKIPSRFSRLSLCKQQHRYTLLSVKVAASHGVLVAVGVILVCGLRQSVSEITRFQDGIKLAA